MFYVKHRKEVNIIERLINRLLICILLIIAVSAQSYATLLFAAFTYLTIKELEKID